MLQLVVGFRPFPIGHCFSRVEILPDVDIVTMFPHPSLTVRVLDRSDKTITDYCSSFNILKGIKDINIASEEMSVNCLNGVWC